MRELFNDILDIEGVKGLILLSSSGEMLFGELKHKTAEDIESREWHLLIESLAGMRETDLIFEKGRLYIRKTDMGYLIVMIGPLVPIAMIRLQCDIILPSLKPATPAKGIRRFFKK